MSCTNAVELIKLRSQFLFPLTSTIEYNDPNNRSLVKNEVVLCPRCDRHASGPGARPAPALLSHGSLGKTVIYWCRRYAKGHKLIISEINYLACLIECQQIYEIIESARYHPTLCTGSGLNKYLFESYVKNNNGNDARVDCTSNQENMLASIRTSMKAFMQSSVQKWKLVMISSVSSTIT